MQNVAAEKKKKTKNKDAVRLPNKALYSFAAGVLKLTFNNYFRVKIDRKDIKKLKGPCVILCNHCSRIDWILVGTAMLPKKINVVITRFYYSIPALRFFLRKVGAIPKDQFSPDVKAIKSMLTAAKLGGNVMLFPEGRMAPGGVGEKIEESIVKLLRHLKLPVVGVHLYGAYMTYPKWATDMRRGRIEVKASTILTPEKMAEMTDDQIYEFIVNNLKTDEAAWQKERRIAYKSRKMAEGLHDVLFLCPKCGAEHTMRTEKDIIKCENCGNGARLNKYYDLVPLDDSCVIPENIGVWYKMQEKHISELIAADPEVFMSDHATLLTTTEDTWLRPVGEGEIRADRSGFTYSGTKNGEPFELNIPIASMPAVAFSQGKSIETYYNGEFYSFEMTRGIESQRWSMFIEQMHNSVKE